MNVLEQGLIPDWAVRFGIRRISRSRLREQRAAGATGKQTFLQAAAAAPVALETGAANEQHYEVPAEFYHLALGPHLKYSSAIWEGAVVHLADAERAMLRLTMQRAELVDGMEILELGCGWGSLTLAMAEQFPNSRITAVSNSHSQRAYILGQAAKRKLHNITVLTADMNVFTVGNRFDRVVSVEMFEHMRNYNNLLERVCGWLKPEGKIFIHIFCHETWAYPYEDRDASDWMARHFFTGGMMPSFDLFENHADAVDVETAWRVPGTHYAATANAWLENIDRHRDEVLALFAETYGADNARMWFNRWRVFLWLAPRCSVSKTAASGLSGITC